MEISEVLNNILMSAYNEAKNRHHEYLTPEHILYASLYYDEGKKIVTGAGANVEKIILDIEDYFKKHLNGVDDLNKSEEGDKLKESLKNENNEKNDDEDKKNDDEDDPVQSIGFKNVMERAIWHNTSAQREYLDIGDVVVAMYDEEESFGSFFLKKQGITRLSLLNFVSHGVEPYPENEESSKEDEDSDKEKDSKILSSFTTELVEKAKKGEMDPLIGRETIIERTIQVMCRRMKNNPIHVGDPGVGKTSITEGLAQLIAEEKVPTPLLGAKIYLLDMASLLAGTKFRGDFEDRMKKVVSELGEMENAVLFIDEIHSIVGAGAVSGGSMDASNMLKPILAMGNVKCIGSTTYEEYRKYFEKDRALSRRFQKIDIPEPSIEETHEILIGLKNRYEEFHDVKYSDEALVSAAKLSSKYLTDRHLPDKAIDVIDEAGAYKRIKRTDQDNEIMEVSVHDVEMVVAKIAKIPEKSVSSSEMEKLKDMTHELKKRIFGQDFAVSQVVESIKRSRAGFGNPDKPVASFLFVGPTGVGKTELANQLADFLNIPLQRYDMSEYQEKHTVARLIGSPPGYVGYDEGGLLTEAIRKSPYCVLLLDEIEKAHSDIFNTLLQVMDYATLTDNAGKKADFKNVIIIMTSNAGAREIGKSKVGFDERTVKDDVINEAVDRLFSPEFRNRLDSIVTFKNLDMDILVDIVKREIDKFKIQLEEKQVELVLTDECYKWIAEKGYSPEFGARQIVRIIQEKIKVFFVDEVLFGSLKNGGKAIADIVDDDVKIKTT